MGATIATIIAGTQTGIATASHLQAAQAASLRGRFENDIAERNAKLAEKQGEDALNVGNFEENRMRLQTEQEEGATRAAAGASGASVASGSAVDVRASQQLVGDVDALTIRNNAARQAWGYDVEAANERMQGRLALLAGENEAATERTGAATTLLTGAANMYSLSKLRVAKPTTPTPPPPPPAQTYDNLYGAGQRPG